MRRILLLKVLLVLFVGSQAQNLSFTCPRDTTLSCGTTCITLKARFPDLRGLSDNYTIGNISTEARCRPYVPPDIPGNPTSITLDDRYSQIIPIGFNFPFYNITYPSLVISANGYISFDFLVNANQYSHYTISSGLPSTSYDRALIMGPYHDLNLEYNTSPNRRLKYDLIGTAPNRKFIISYYKMPLYSVSCQNLIENTHQIVLHESTGVIEVYIFDKQICANWPPAPGMGKAIVGLQDYSRTKGIEAPGRGFSDPPWGSPRMNEVWRFIPSQGATLYRSVQLLNASGTVIATGDTTRVNANTFEASFPNICPPPGVTTTYVVKTTYQKIDDPLATIYSLDTVNITRQTNLPSSGVATATTCGSSTGTITVTVTGGTAPYTYSINGGPGQLSNIFTGLGIGTYTILVSDAAGCFNSFPVTVTGTTGISGSATFTATACSAASNGTITVTPTAGVSPYTYRLDGGAPQAGNIFTGVSSGPHTVTFADSFGCIGSVTVTITVGPNITGSATSTATSCPGVSNGTITATPTSGTGPYTYKLDAGPSQPGNVFSGVAQGAHTVTITDIYGCAVTVNVAVGQGSNIITSVTSTGPPCAGINNGTITITPMSGVGPYQYSLNGGTPQASNIFTGLPAGTYNITITNATGCNGTNSATLTTNNPIGTTLTKTMPLCNGNANGSVTLNALGGLSPYQYSKNAGVTYQGSGTFTGLAAGTYTFRIKDNVGCTKDTTIVIGQPSSLTASANGTPTTCTGNDGRVTVTAGGGTPGYQYSIDNGITYQSSNIFVAPGGVYNNIKIKDVNGCIANATATVVLLDDMFLTVGRDTTICVGKSITFQPQTNAQTSIYKWRPSTGIANDTIKNAIATPADTSTYILHATYGACFREDTLTVNVLHKPVPYAGLDTPICNKTFAILRGSATNLSGGVNYTWSPTTGVVSPTLPVTNVFPPGTGPRAYTLTVTDNYGCNFSVTDDVMITVQPPVPAYAGHDTIAVKGVPHQLFGGGGNKYLWTPSAHLNNPTAQNPLATLSSDTRFIVKVTDFAGCIGYDTVFMKVYTGPAYYIPNAFSPNGDGLNDIFRAVPVGIKTTEYFRIFNRFGELIFETNEWLKGWDGRYKGTKQPLGVYIWIIKGIDRNGKDVEMKGTVMIVQ
ncbi:MAG TPA: gliding motility-associated C-terminal domain-containing protein [Ferruginibacter sp.]|nr:gliding motility-associated C-terminal domain-containing protein [Ferruginibacter sp.]